MMTVKKGFLVRRPKWQFVREILEKNRDGFTITAEDDKGVMIETALPEKELKALCDLARSVELKDYDGGHVDGIVFPLSILKDDRLRKKYVGNRHAFLVWEDEAEEFLRLGL